jgi:hypothetical protein
MNRKTHPIMEKETWITAVLSSELITASPASSPDLFLKIKNRIQAEQVSFQWAMPIAAASLVVIGLNILFVLNQNNKAKANSTTNEISYLTTSNQLYSHVEN